MFMKKHTRPLPLPFHICAKRGAALLDVLVPEWYRDVDNHVLSMISGTASLWAQLCKCRFEEMAQLKLKPSEMISYGFDVDRALHAGDNALVILALVWRKEIAKRR